jgi:hypothetical protein
MHRTDQGGTSHHIDTNSVEAMLSWLYDREQNVMLQSVYDGGWHASLGDPSNGFVEACDSFETPLAACRWLVETCIKLQDMRLAAAGAAS